MKDLKDFLNESLVNESKISSIGASSIVEFLKGGEDWSVLSGDFGWDQKYVDLLKDHAKFIEADGGYNGDGDGWIIDTTEDEEFDNKSLGYGRVNLRTPSIKKLLDNKKVKDLLGIKDVKAAGIYWISGYNSPTLIAFDIDNADVKKILDNIEEEL